jgi:hypothetical protein
MPDVTAERVARNQSAFRGANENMAAAADRLLDEGAMAPFLCECPDRSCTAIARVSLADYERVRLRGDLFLVVPGHEVCVVDGVEVARVAQRHDAYSVMEKIGEAGEVARAEDPRG